MVFHYQPPSSVWSSPTCHSSRPHQPVPAPVLLAIPQTCQARIHLRAFAHAAHTPGMNVLPSDIHTAIPSPVPHLCWNATFPVEPSLTTLFKIPCLFPSETLSSLPTCLIFFTQLSPCNIIYILPSSLFIMCSSPQNQCVSPMRPGILMFYSMLHLSSLSQGLACLRCSKNVFWLLNW